MGDNAQISRDWHNTALGKGYCARGVVRQRTAGVAKVAIVNRSVVVDPPIPAHKYINNTQLKRKKIKRARSLGFDPVLQNFCSRISSQSAVFSVGPKGNPLA